MAQGVFRRDPLVWLTLKERLEQIQSVGIQLGEQLVKGLGRKVGKVGLEFWVLGDPRNKRQREEREKRRRKRTREKRKIALNILS